MGNYKGHRGKPLLEQARELGIEIPEGVSRQRIFQMIQEKKAGHVAVPRGSRPENSLESGFNRRRKGTTRNIARTFW
jgi:hypothetical protein